MWIRSETLVFCVVVAMFFAGCSGSPTPKELERVEVKGRVTLDGKPLSGANLRFIPSTTKTPGKGGWALTDDDGRYVAKSSDGAAELPTGEYQVLVTSGAPLEDADAPPPTKTPGQATVPALYGDIGRSPLVVGFRRGAGEGNIELRSK